MGGFSCELHDDGSVQNDQKYIWYQGRWIWVYSYLYNNLCGDKGQLAIAKKSRDFMIDKMYAGGGKWNEHVKRDGTLLKGVGASIYGWLFAAIGLIEYYKASGDAESLKLAEESIRTAWRDYESDDYKGVDTGYTSVIVDDSTGLRCHGHSMIFVWVLTELLKVRKSDEFERIQAANVDAIVNRFWNAELGIVNEFCNHDYSRFTGAAEHMYAGHALEGCWMLMAEAERKGDAKLFDTATGRFKRVLKLCWDPIFDGFADTNFYAVKTGDHCAGPDFDEKTMWANCEILIGCMMLMEKRQDTWAAEWYKRAEDYLFAHHANTECGIWRQAVDRRGNDKTRVGISPYRKGNFHQPRMLMMNLALMQ
jgi:mannose/cellobiose epimerase-like protein (N-acyl-D-glucosamine 2-epimerase family)